jgi:hypothetical protein
MKALLKAPRRMDSPMSPTASRVRSSKRLPPACEAAERRWILLRDDELPEAEVAALRRHLGNCTRCRRSIRLVDGLLATIRDEPMPEPDDAFWDRMRERIMARIRAGAPPSAFA